MSSPNATPQDSSRENEPAPDNPLEDALWAALARVEDPELRRPITELGMVEYARVLAEEDNPQRHYAQVKVLLTIEGCPLKNTIDAQVREAAIAVTGIDRVQLELGAMNSEQRGALKSRLKPERTNPFTASGSLTRIFGVVSGKGGVGKSSMTANLAAAFASRGLAVGIIDADVHGFSIPGLMGITEAPTRLDDLIIPPTVDIPNSARGKDDTGAQESAAGASGGFVKVISIGMFLKDNQPVAWRGPMLHRALEQFILDVHFGALDVLLLDLPPGTGDIAISMAQLLPNAELILVSTPQHAAVGVAERAGTPRPQTTQKGGGGGCRRTCRYPQPADTAKGGGRDREYGGDDSTRRHCVRDVRFRRRRTSGDTSDRGAGLLGAAARFGSS
jgi:mrp ATPase family protein